MKRPKVERKGGRERAVEGGRLGKRGRWVMC